MNLLFLKILIVLSMFMSCINEANIKFVYYDDLEFDLSKSNINLEEISKKYDFLKILLLDSSKKQLLFEFDAELKIDYADFSKGLELSNSTVSYKTGVNDIREIFKSKISIDSFINNLYDDLIIASGNLHISYPIYVKDNLAVIEIMFKDGYDIFFLKLDEKLLYINWLGGISE